MISLHSFVDLLFPQLALVLILSSWVAILICPRSSFPFLIAGLVPCWTLIWWLIFRPLPYGDDWGWFSQGLILLALMFTITAAVLRFVLSSIRQSSSDVALEPLDWRFTKWSVTATVLAAGMLELGPSFARVIGAAAVISTVVAVVLLSLIFAWRHRARGQAYGFALTIAVTLGLATVATLTWPFAVVSAAQASANGFPYCLLVADGQTRHRPAQNMLDLTPIVMRATENRGRALNRHSYLVVSKRPLPHWSYMRGRYIGTSTPTMGDDHRTPDTLCLPAKDFAKRLPLF